MADPAGTPAPGPAHRATPALAEPAERGTTAIADSVVTRIAQAATAEVEAVIDTRRGWTKLVRKGFPHAESVVAGTTAQIRVEVAATWPVSLPELSAHVRDHVTERVTRLTGMRVSRVDVTVADVVHVETAQRRVR